MLKGIIGFISIMFGAYQLHLYKEYFNPETIEVMGLCVSLGFFMCGVVLLVQFYKEKW